MLINLNGPPGMYAPPYTAMNDHNNDTTSANTMAGTDIAALPKHQEALEETESNRVECVSDYRRRNIVLIKWLKENYQGYHNLVVFDLSAEHMSNRRVYFTAKQDLQYNILNPKFMQLFISAHKIKTATK